ncbi:hypothetical protein [Mesoplasma melaleucae]|uniref:Uncharacterized protein n=1 Tax=Mesoplasma melaleucae TaxID=81459 RepID=A0A2K8NZ66_9MOLU|nr:hypothetical protein [Mesoplasma melaleucae]ATZ17933.1 hypothetical protein EMELA_v1c03710 [Mesoplasma melaleucae]
MATRILYIINESKDENITTYEIEEESFSDELFIGSTVSQDEILKIYVKGE